MENINCVIEIAKQSHHLPWVLSFLIGLCIVRKEQSEYEGELFGDNVPTTLIEGLGR